MLTIPRLLGGAVAPFRWTWLVAVSLALWSVGCGSGTPTTPTPTSSPSPTASPTPSPAPSPAPTPPSCTLPAAPTSLVASVSGSRVSFTWSGPASSSTYVYVIGIGRSSGASDVDSKSVDTGATLFAWTPAPTGTYFSRVRARNACGTGPASNEVTFIVGAAPAPSPSPSPTPSPSPSPSPTPTSSAYYVWGGSSYDVYLGSFSCTFCTDYGTESINNSYGTHGSKYSSSSIRNPYGTYGGKYSSYSPCNEYTNAAPKVYNSNKTIYYGVLTVNRYASGHISALYSWLVGDVCIS